MKSKAAIKFTSISIPAERVVCRFCGAKLGRMNRMNVCTSAGVVILTCNTHAEAGDRLVRLAQAASAYALAGADVDDEG